MQPASLRVPDIVMAEVWAEHGRHTTLTAIKQVPSTFLRHRGSADTG
jgi:hypothetical protein